VKEKGRPMTKLDAPIKSTVDAIHVAQMWLTQAEAHYMMRHYRPDDAELGHELTKCLTLARVAVAIALDIENGSAEL